jgi:phage tail-like protein
MSASDRRHDPVRVFNFLITLVDSSSQMASVTLNITLAPQAGFSECSGLELSMQPEEYREGGRNDTVLKFCGRAGWSNIRLRRGAALTDDLWNWHYGFLQGQGKRRDGIIVLQDEQHQPVKVWRFSRGLPVKWTGPSLNAGQSQVAIEEVEIAHEGLKIGPTGAAAIGQAIRSLF